MEYMAIHPGYVIRIIRWRSLISPSEQLSAHSFTERQVAAILQQFTSKNHHFLQNMWLIKQSLPPCDTPPPSLDPESLRRYSTIMVSASGITPASLSQVTPSWTMPTRSV